MKDPRVIILGGGVIGMCAAYHVLKKGLAVQLIERETPGGDNCSMGNAGMIVPSHFVPLAAPGMISKGLRWMLNAESPFYIRPRLSPELARWAWLFFQHSTPKHVEDTKQLLLDLNLESRRLFTELAKEDDFGLTTRGLLMLCKTGKGLDEEAEVAEAAREIGLPAEVVDAATAAKLDPGVTMDIKGAVYFPQDCHLDPARFLEILRRRVIAMGGQIVSGVEIERLETKGGKVVAACSKTERFEGDKFVVAGGSWTSGILKKVGLKMPLQAGKGYSLTLNKPPELPQLCSIFTEAKVAITPMGDTLRFAGTMEVGGLNLDVNPARVRGIIKSVHSYFPKFDESDFVDVKPWAGLRPVSPDGLPYIGKVPHLSNLVAASGHAMMGLSLGPVTGLLVANLLSEEKPFRPIEQMAVARFA
jgi:D-amino-acid dehydrogenase